MFLIKINTNHRTCLNNNNLYKINFNNNNSKQKDQIHLNNQYLINQYNQGIINLIQVKRHLKGQYKSLWKVMIVQLYILKKW